MRFGPSASLEAMGWPERVDGANGVARSAMRAIAAEAAAVRRDG